jgi:hypothetical protein
MMKIKIKRRKVAKHSLNSMAVVRVRSICYASYSVLIFAQTLSRGRGGTSVDSRSSYPAQKATPRNSSPMSPPEERPCRNALSLPTAAQNNSAYEHVIVLSITADRQEHASHMASRCRRSSIRGADGASPRAFNGGNLHLRPLGKSRLVLGSEEPGAGIESSNW